MNKKETGVCTSTPLLASGLSKLTKVETTPPSPHAGSFYVR